MIQKFRLVRGSEVQDFLRCRKRWQHKWVDRLIPKRQDGKLFFGNMFHKFTQVYNLERNEKLAFDAMSKMYKETNTSRMNQVELDELMQLLFKVCKNYVVMWAAADAKRTTLATELQFAIPLASGLMYTGTIDHIFLDEARRLWFEDHKSAASIGLYVDRAPMDRQISRYYWALQQLIKGEGYVKDMLDDVMEWIPAGEWIYNNFGALPDPYGFVYNIIRKKAPEQPEPLQKGGISVKKAQDTTVALYLKALVEGGYAVLDPEGGVITDTKYEEMLDHLRAQEDEHGNKFFKRIEVFRNQVDIEASMQEFYATAMDMVNVRELLQRDNLPHDPIYRNINDDCGWDCQTKQLCIATMDGSTCNDIIQLFYDKDTEPEDEFMEVEM